MEKTLAENNYLIIQSIWIRRNYFIFLSLLFAFIFSIFYQLTPEKYEVSLRLLIQNTRELNPQLSDLSLDTINRKTIFYDHLLKSDRVLNDAIKKLPKSLQEESNIKERIRDGLELTHSSYSKNDKNVFKIKFKWEESENILKIFNAVTTEYIKEFNFYTINNIMESQNFVDNKLKLIKSNILDSEKKIMEFKLKNKNIAPDLLYSDYRETANIDKKIIDKEIELIGAREKLLIQEKRMKRNNPLKKMLEKEIEIHQKILSEYNLKYTDNHSLVIEQKNILKQLTDDYDNIQDEKVVMSISEIKKHIETHETKQIPFFLLEQIASLENTNLLINTLERELLGLKKFKNNLEDRTNNFGEAYAKLKELEQDLNIKKDEYEKLLLKSEKIKLNKEVKQFEEKDQIQIMNQGTIKVQRLKHSLFVHFTLGFIFGILLSLSYSVLMYLTNTKINKRSDAEHLLNSSVITRIPDIK